MQHPITHLLPPYPTSANAKVQAAMELLAAKQCTEDTQTLLAAIVDTILSSEEFSQRFLPVAKAIAIPQNWSQPLFQIDQVVWHRCEQYCILGLAIDPPMDMWKYWLKALNSNRYRWAYEYQIGINQPACCDDK